MLAKHALYQLSYGPLSGAPSLELSFVPLSDPRLLVGPGRLELPTSRLSGVRSNHLSYGPPGSATPLGAGQLTGAFLGLAIASRILLASPDVTRRKATNGKRNEDGGIPHL